MKLARSNPKCCKNSNRKPLGVINQLELEPLLCAVNRHGENVRKALTNFRMYASLVVRVRNDSKSENKTCLTVGDYPGDVPT